MTIVEALNILELEDQTIIGRLQTASDYDVACKVIEDLHTIVRKQKRLLSKKYHPDKGGDEDRIKLVNAVCDNLLKIKAEPVIQTPIFHFHTVIIRSETYYGATTTSATTNSW